MMKNPRHCVLLQQKRRVYCQQACEPGETSFAVLGSWRYMGFTDVFEMPPPGMMCQRYALVHFAEGNAAQRCALCLRPACGSCTSSPDSYLAHKECLDIRTNILPSKATCEEIWDIGVATKEWFVSPEQETFKTSKWELQALFPQLSNDGSGTRELLRKLLSLPDELFRIIMWEMADRSTVSRITLISQLNAGLLDELKRKHPVTELEFFSPQLSMYSFDFLGVQYQPLLKGTQCTTDRAVIRLGVDNFGIRTAEITEGYHVTSSQLSRKCAWFFVERLCRARALYKIVSSGPFLRIVSRAYDTVQLWSVMSPPEYGTYHSVGRHSTSPRRTRCIDLRGVTGLTVFCDTRSIYGIHAHRADEIAISTYLRLYPSCRHHIMWRYFHFSPGEVITRAWIRKDSGFTHGTILVISTSYDRSCVFGASREGEDAPYQVLCDTSMTHLLYDNPALGESISCFDAAPKPSSSPHMDVEDDGSDPDLHFTCASLIHVVQAEVYSDEHGASTGILFRYSDGSSECIGQRRVGMSTTKITKVNHPDQICTRSFEIRTHDHRMLPCKRQCVEISLSSGDAELRPEEWQSQDMIGSVTWSFRLRKDVVQFSMG